MKKNKLFWLAFLVYLGGVLFRFYYLFRIHPPTDYIYSDMLSYVNNARNFFDPHYRGMIGDVFYPPMASWFFGLFYLLDPSWKLAIVAQGILSSLLPLLAGLIAHELFGRRTALVTLLLTTLYYPFIAYAGYFLSENLFAFTLLLSFWLLLFGLKRNFWWQRSLLGLASGIAVAAAAGTKSNVLLPALLVLLYLFYRGIRRQAKVGAIMIAGSLGVLLVLLPLAKRCTERNEGRFCLISTNGPMNFLVGHQGLVGHHHFNDTKRGFLYSFGNPALLQHVYTGEKTYPFGPYDSRDAHAEAFRWIRENPLEAFVLSIEHLFDLFIDTIAWPSSHAKERTAMVLFQRLYLLFILLPCLFFVWKERKRLLALDPALFGEWMLLLPIIGIMLTAFLYYGDPRYRIPYDGFLITLAAKNYLRTTL